MPQHAGIGEVPVALISHLDVCSANGAGFDLQQGSSPRCRRVGQVIQLQDSGALRTAAFIKGDLFLRQLHRHQHSVRLLDELLLAKSVKPGQEAGGSHAHTLLDIALSIDLHGRDFGVFQARI